MLCSKLFCVAHSSCLGQWKSALSVKSNPNIRRLQAKDWTRSGTPCGCLFDADFTAIEWALNLVTRSSFLAECQVTKLALRKCQAFPVPPQQKIQSFCQQLLSPWYSQVIFTKLRSRMHCPTLHFTSAKLLKISRVRTYISCRILNIILLNLKTCILYCRKINK